MSATDPRRLGGGIAGPGGAHDRGGVVIDTRNAVLHQGTTVAMVDGAEQLTIALELEGRVNRSSDRARVLYLLPIDGAAALISELIGVVSRAGDEARAELDVAVMRRLEQLP